MKPSWTDAIEAFRKERDIARHRKEIRDAKTWKDLKDFAKAVSWEEFLEKQEKGAE